MVIVFLAANSPLNFTVFDDSCPDSRQPPTPSDHLIKAPWKQTTHPLYSFYGDYDLIKTRGRVGTMIEVMDSRSSMMSQVNHRLPLTPPKVHNLDEMSFFNEQV